MTALLLGAVLGIAPMVLGLLNTQMEISTLVFSAMYMKDHVGSYNWKEGNFYIGEYANNKANGQGLEYYSSVESTYYGEFFNAKRHGLGAYLNKSDELKSKGYWENGELKTPM